MEWSAHGGNGVAEVIGSDRGSLCASNAATYSVQMCPLPPEDLKTMENSFKFKGGTTTLTSW